MIANDPLYKAQYVPQLLEVPSIWEVPQNNRPHVGLIDTPALETHPDLSQVTHISTPIQPTSHGTELVGIIAADRNNNEGIAGLCDCDVSVAPLKTPEPAPGILATAMRSLVDRDCELICLPYRGPTSQELTDTIDSAAAAGTLVITAAGNGPTTFADHTGYHQDVLCVGAVTQSLSPAPFGKLGGVDVFAPGEAVIAPTVGDQNYDYVSGTSYACAVVTGIAALVQSRTGMSGRQLLSHLEDTALELPIKRQLMAGHSPEPIKLIRPVIKNSFRDDK